MGLFGKNDEGEKIIIPVEGMSCGHCELHVQEAVSKIEGVQKAKASKSKKTLQVTLAKGARVDIRVLVDAVNETGYPASMPAEK